MRRADDRPTTIYWLIDTRSGLPFYCGKTVFSAERRFAQHQCAAINGARTPTSKRIRACGDGIRIHIVEVVPVGGDWQYREQSWIRVLRGSFPDCTNVADGGQGAAGVIHSTRSRANMRKGQQNSARAKYVAEGKRYDRINRRKMRHELREKYKAFSSISG